MRTGTMARHTDKLEERHYIRPSESLYMSLLRPTGPKVERKRHPRYVWSPIEESPRRRGPPVLHVDDKSFHKAFRAWLQSGPETIGYFSYKDTPFRIAHGGHKLVTVYMNTFDFLTMSIIVLNAAWNKLQTMFVGKSITAHIDYLRPYGFKLATDRVVFGPAVGTPYILDLAKRAVSTTQ